MGARERGFTLLEVLVASALTICVLLAAAGAVAHALRGSAVADEEMALRDDALSVLADMRAVTTYDEMTDSVNSRVHKLVGHSASMTLRAGAGSAETITVIITQASGAPNPVAQATVTKDGTTVSERATLSVEAPSPGTAVDQ